MFAPPLNKTFRVPPTRGSVVSHCSLMCNDSTVGSTPFQSLWHKHPGVRSGDDLSRGERAADRMRNIMGSWGFVFGFFAVMILWAIVNTFFFVHVLHHKAFDPYPYILLNLFLSMMAGVQAAALLIAAKRADSISSRWNGTSVTPLIAGETSSTRSTFGNGLVEQQDLLLVGRLKDRCPPFKVSPCHRRGCPLARRIATFSSLD
jgi:hypothetical protein